MKSKRRHELQTNELADRLGHWIEGVRPHLPTFAMVAVAVAAIVGAWFYWASSQEKLVAQAWRSYMFAGSDPQGDLLAELNMVAEEFADTQAGLWAAQGAADLEAGQAARQLFTARAEAEKKLAAASSGYKSVLNSELIKKSPLLERRAHYGLAQTLEADNQLDAAIEQYKAVIDADPESALAQAAQRRVDHLSKTSTVKWYNWFANQTAMTRAPATGMGAGGGLGLPGISPDNLLDEPGPGFMDSTPDDSGAAKPATTPEATEDTSAPPAAKEARADAATGAETSETEKSAPALEGPNSEPPAAEPPKKSPAAAGNENGG